MQRRELLKAFGAGAVLGMPAFASIAYERDPAQAWHDAFVDVPETRGPTVVAFEGRLPAGLAGTLFRNGPARMHRGPTSYRHWFDGDGMVHAYRLGAGRLTHRAAMVRTARYVEEERAGRFLRGGFGTAFADALPVATPDDMNVANISVLPLPGADGRPELLALWEGGSPYRIDPATLATRGRKVWSSETDGLPFSAHPKIDADGTVWSFGYLPGSGKLALYQLSASGALVRASLIDAPNADMVHDFALTERSLVFLLMPLEYQADDHEAAFVDRYRWRAEKPSVLLVLDKATWQPTLRVELPAFALFHLGNAWEAQGSLHVPAVEVKDFGVTMAGICALTEGRVATHDSRSELIEVVADVPGRRAKIERTGLHATEFPVWDKRCTGRRSASHYGVVRTASASVAFNGVARFDWASGNVDAYDYGAELFAEEHVFVARPGAAADRGWLVGTALHWPSRTTRLSVFDAGHVGAGPIAQARLPYGVPLGLHGAFVAA